MTQVCVTTAYLEKFQTVTQPVRHDSGKVRYRGSDNLQGLQIGGYRH